MARREKNLSYSDVENTEAYGNKTSEAAKKVFLEYNPYLVRTTVSEEEGSKKSLNDTFEYTKDRRLQQVLDPNNIIHNWGGLFQELEKWSNQVPVQIYFRGRAIDNEDLQAAWERYSKPLCGKSVILKPEFEPKESLQESRILRNLENFVQNLFPAPDQALMNKLRKAVDKEYAEAKKAEFTISVIAPMSSGKSTVLNAMVGEDLLPTDADSCTATVARIAANQEMQWFTVTRKDKNKTIIGVPREEATWDLLNQYNKDPKVCYLDLEGPLPNIASKSMQVILQDTPGPNSAENREHRAITQNIIEDDDNLSLVMFVLDMSAGTTTDEAIGLIREVENHIRGSNNKQIRDRFFFVLNKCDTHDPKKGSFSKKYKEKKAGLEKMLAMEDIHLFFISAQQAFCIRKKEKLSEKELSKNERSSYRDAKESVEEDSQEYFLEDYATLSPSCREKLDHELCEAKRAGDIDQQALIHTGIRGLELSIQEYLDKYAFPMKVQKATEKLRYILQDETLWNKLERDISGGEVSIQDIEEKIKEFKKKNEELSAKKQEFQGKLNAYQIPNEIQDNSTKWLWSEMQRLPEKYLPKDKEEDKNVSPEKAKAILKDFEKDANEIQKKVIQDLQNELEQNIIQVGEKLLRDYTQQIQKIQKNLKIGSYDFGQLSGFHSFEVENFNDLVKQYTETKCEYGTKEIKNPERRGFWGFFKFWEPKKITVTDYEKILSKTDLVDIQTLIVEQIPKLSDNCENDIEVLLEQAQAMVAGFRSIFNKNLTNLDAFIQETLRTIANKTTEQANQEATQKNLQGQLEWLKQKLTELEEAVGCQEDKHGH